MGALTMSTTQLYLACINVVFEAQDEDDAKARAERLAKELTNTYPGWVGSAEADDVEPFQGE